MDDVKLAIKRIFEVASVEEARKYKQAFIEQYGSNAKLEKVMEILDEGFEDAVQYLNEYAHYHKHIRSTNSLERINEEVRRREKVIRIFPNIQSAYRLIGAVLMDYAEELAKRKLPEKKK